MNNKANKKIIYVTNFSHSNNNEIEIINDNGNDLKNKLINENYDNDFIETVTNFIFEQLELDDFLMKNKLTKNIAFNTVKAMHNNFLYDKFDKNGKLIKSHKNFILAEFLIPLFLKRRFSNKYKWIYCNQIFNYDSNPLKPATGLDCALSYKDEINNKNKIIYTEIKSSISKSSYNLNLDKAIKSFSEKSEKELDSIKFKIMNINREISSTLDFDYKTFLIGTLFIDHDVSNLDENIDIPINIKDRSISILNLKIESEKK